LKESILDKDKVLFLSAYYKEEEESLILQKQNKVSLIPASYACGTVRLAKITALRL
jgi:hypothetical protein